MLNTYLNDNQHRPYPLYGGVKLPFPMSCITGLGLCIQNSDNTNPVYASTIAISKTSIRIAFCRHVSSTEAAPEFVGMVYADTTGYYTYVASSSNSTVYEVDLRPDPVDLNRIVFATFVDPESTAEEYASAVLADMQVFYSFFRDYDRSGIKSTGYLQVGTIPDDAVGVYTGEFYLDPSCVTFMPASVLGYHTEMVVNNTKQYTGHAIEFAANGLLTVAVDAGTLFFGCIESADENQLNDYPEHDMEFVEFLKGYTTSGMHNLILNDYLSDISWKVAELDDSVILTVAGHNNFPACYTRGEDQA